MAQEESEMADDWSEIYVNAELTALVKRTGRLTLIKIREQYGDTIAGELIVDRDTLKRILKESSDSEKSENYGIREV